MGFCRANRDLAGILQRKVLEGPRHVVIDLTNRCNTNCKVCWTYSPLLKPENKPEKSWFKEEIPPEDFESLVEDLHELGVERIRFTGGGEPLLYRSFERAVRSVKDKGIWLAITTNGLLMRKNHDLLVQSGVDEIAVSLWAASEKSYRTLHPKAREGDFYEILEGIRDLRRDAPHTEVHLLNVISKENFHEISRMADLGRNLGVQAVYFTLVDPMEDTRSEMLDEFQRKDALEEIERVKSRFYNQNSEIHWDNLDGFETRLEDVHDGDQYDRMAIDELPCYMGWHFTRVTANGQVSPCCRGVDYPMGFLGDSRFRDIWASKKYLEFRENSLFKKKDIPYFEKMNCYQMCDNLMHNRQIQERIGALSDDQRKELLNYESEVLQEVEETEG
ncbi:radical SAM protein [bacterium]|nr:radical SAM protein [bacterium]